MLKDDKSIDEIEEAVLAELYAAVNPRTNELCLRPEFLGRIVKNGEIIVFNPLTLEAMTMITGKLLDKEIAEWNEARDSQMIVENEVIEYIGKKCFAINEKDLQAVYKPAEYSRAGRPQSVQYKGGRIIHSMINKFIMDDLVKNVIKYSQSLQVRVKLDGDDVVIECIEDEKILEGKTNEDIEKIRISIQEIKTQIDTEFTKLLAKKDEDEVKEIYEAINSLKNTLEE